MAAGMVEEARPEQRDELGAEKKRLEETQRRHAQSEKALEVERDFLAAIFASAAAFILVLDTSGRILRVNRAVELATGFSDNDLRGRSFTSTLPIRESAAMFTARLEALARGDSTYPFESHWATSTGERILVAGSLTPMRDPGETLSNVIITASDITERRALEEELRAMTLRDDLTGLYNRRGFALLAEQRLKDSRRSESPLTIVYADVDELKSINDVFGHRAGDIALGVCANALENTFRESDIVARIGGDEFVVLAEADAREIGTVSLRLDEELDRRTAESGLRFPVSLTIGSAHSQPPHTLSLDDLLEAADAFMYERKHRIPPLSE
jgi:diguanylate cyclase (GGDEF)-like protein/PAS domain S-box-containing protein